MSETKLRTTSDRRSWRKYAAGALSVLVANEEQYDDDCVRRAAAAADLMLAEEQKRRSHESHES